MLVDGTAEGPIGAGIGYLWPLVHSIDSRLEAGTIHNSNLEIMMKTKTFFLVVVAGGFGVAAILTLLGLA